MGYIVKKEKTCTMFLSRNAVGTQADRQVFPYHYQVFPNFHKCFYNLLETQRTCLLLF